MAGIDPYEFRGDDIEEFITENYGFSGDIVSLMARNDGPIVHKWLHYLPVYDQYFSRFRGTKLKFLEIGVSKGGSLKLWREYFGADAVIFGIDIEPTCAEQNGKYGQVRIGSQIDFEFLNDVIKEMGGVDIVLDDGSHQMDHVSKTMKFLFPKLRSPGVYLIEDLHTAYWPEYGGGIRSKKNFFNYLGVFAETIHRWYWEIEEQKKPKSKMQKLFGKFFVDSDCGSLKSKEDSQLRGFEDLVSFHIHDSICVLNKGKCVPPVHTKVGTE